MTSHISRPAYGTDFFHNFDKFWTDFLQFSAKDGGVSHRDNDLGANVLERSPPFGDGSIFHLSLQNFFHILENVFAETLKHCD